MKTTYKAVRSVNVQCCLSRSWSKEMKRLSHKRVRKQGKKETNE